MTAPQGLPNAPLSALARAVDSLSFSPDESSGSTVSFDSVFLADFARCVTVAECVTGSTLAAKHIVLDSYAPIYHSWEEVKDAPSEIDFRSQVATLELSQRAKARQPDLPNEFAEGAHPGRRLEDGPLAAVAELGVFQRAVVSATAVFGGTGEYLGRLLGVKENQHAKELTDALSTITHIAGPGVADLAAIGRAFRSRTNRHAVNDDRFLLLRTVKGAQVGDPPSGAYEKKRGGLFRRS